VAGSVDIDVLAGQGVEAVFAAPNSQVARVEVNGRRTRIDLSRADNGATFTARELAALPIAKTVDAIVQLAPNTTRGDPTYVAGSSFGGGAASENAYYINGFAVTNPLSQLGGSELPFGAIAQAQILTGGFGAEFGRSTGGVINITTKSGTNSWEIGLQAQTSPKSWRAKYDDYYYMNTGIAPTTDGKVRVSREQNTYTQTQYSGSIGGPIIKDKLFMFIAGEMTRTEDSRVNLARTATTLGSNGWVDRVIKTPRYLSKFDWNITDNHRLEATFIGDLPEVNSNFRSYDYNTKVIGSTVKSSQHEELNGTFAPNGGESKIFRYVGNLTEDLTLTAMWGQSRSVHIFEPSGYNPTMFSVSAPAEVRAPGLNYNNPQSFSGQVSKSGATDMFESARIDLEYKLGSHRLRAGADKNEVSALNAGTDQGGGGQWVYGRTATPGAQTQLNGGVLQPIASFGGLAAQGYFVQKNLHSTVSNAYADQSAWYVEDQWQVTKNVLVTGGLRGESFSNSNQDKVKFVEQKNQISPRLQATWDVNGDNSLKVYGSAGRYTIQMPSVIALRVANGSINTFTNYVYTGTDANGLPTGLTQVGDPLSANNEFGQTKDPKTLASTNLKPAYQDELTLGFEKAWSADLNFGAKVTYRTLKSTIDDWGDDRPFRAYAAANNISLKNWAGFGGGLINPGEDQDFLVDFLGNGTYSKVHVTAAEMFNVKPKRTYAALDAFLEHPMRNGWYGRVNYTLSRNYGNTEGQTLSDTGTAQADVSITQTWDYKEIMDYATGLLPNDRKHQIKAYGFYQVTPEWTVGGNLLVASGRPRSCLGTTPGVGHPYAYTSGEHYCFGTSAKLNEPSERGSLGRLPWDKQLDINVSYRPAILKDLNLKADVFNVFNTQTTVKVVEQYNGTGGVRSGTYESDVSKTAPRYVRVSAEYNHKF
jgi:hypothetical protein